MTEKLIIKTEQYTATITWYMPVVRIKLWSVH